MEAPPPTSFFENLLFAILGGIAAIIVGVGTFSSEKANRKISSVPEETHPRKSAGREELEKIEHEENSERLIEFYRGVDAQSGFPRGKRISTVNSVEPTPL